MDSSVQSDEFLEISEYDDVPEDHWLFKMQGYLSWRVTGPRINNPFEVSYPDRVLIAMAQHRDVVKSHLKVRCLCDGHEVLAADNLSFPQISTNHPCLGGISRSLVQTFLIFYKVDQEIEAVIDRIQEEVRLELDQREKARTTSARSEKTMGQIKAEKEKEKEKANREKINRPSKQKESMRRIIRR
jgi:hypothetical protein